MCDPKTLPVWTRPSISRRQLLAGAGAGAAALALGPAVPAFAHFRRGRRRARLHVISGTHISNVYSMNIASMRDSLVDIARAAPGENALVTVGDLVEYGHAQDYLLHAVSLATSPYPHRRLYAIGNHEYFAGESPDAMRRHFLDYTGDRSVYHCTEVAGIPMVVIGSEGVVTLPNGSTSPNLAKITATQLAWLRRTLAEKTRSHRPTFVFCHQQPSITDAENELHEILGAYPNVVLFFGHLHRDLHWLTEGPDPELLSNLHGYWQVHTGATTYINQYVHNADGTAKVVFQADWAQGLAVDVYDDSVVVRGRDFYHHEWIPTFQAAIPVGPRRARS